MRHTLIDSPDFALLKVSFDAPGEKLVAESGAMVSKSTSLQMTTAMRGGLLAAAKRKLLGGESLFQNTFTSTQAGEEVFLSPPLEGDIHQQVLGPGEVFFLQSGNYLAHMGERMTLDTRWGGVKSFFSGMGFFMLKVTGPGILFYNSYGALHEVQVGADGYKCDTGHIAGFTDGLSYDIQKFGNFKGLFFSGEGLICHFKGTGKLFLQTRNVPALAAFLEPFRRVRRRSSN